MNVTAIVPSLRPDAKLEGVVRDLAHAGFSRVILVDDGSGPEYADVFARAAALCPGSVVLRHEINRGKGCALKTAFAWFLEHPNGDVGVVTVDGDGQHTGEDARRCAEALKKQPGALVLGCRRFDGPDVPARSAAGNRITAACFTFLCGIRVTDTQTGLRAVGGEFLRELLDVKGERYEYETNMLPASKRLGLPIVEVPIRTDYIEENKSSHFHPLRDSAIIYGQILRFLSASLGSTVLDIALFALLNRLFGGMDAHFRLLLATGLARAASSLCNYFANHRLVFRSRESVARSAPRYYTLCVVQAAASYGGVYLLSAILPVPAVPAKLVTDTLLFFLSFQIQREWVFLRKKEK